MEITENDIRRFWEKVDRRGPDECWPWLTARLQRGSYGVLKLATGSSGGRNMVASRIACFLAHGPAPADKPFALHSCDNKGCCNGGHLRWGTKADNVHDAMERGRHVKPPNSWLCGRQHWRNPS